MSWTILAGTYEILEKVQPGPAAGQSEGGEQSCQPMVLAEIQHFAFDLQSRNLPSCGGQPVIRLCALAADMNDRRITEIGDLPTRLPDPAAVIDLLIIDEKPRIEEADLVDSRFSYQIEAAWDQSQARVPA